jgi:hypothetical protein
MGKALFYFVVFARLSICAQGSASVHGEDTRPADATQAPIVELSQMLAMLHHRYVAGPTDWQKEMPPGAKHSEN